MVVKRYLKAVDVVATSGSFEAESHTLGVTIPAANADFCTSGNGIPS